MRHCTCISLQQTTNESLTGHGLDVFVTTNLISPVFGTVATPLDYTCSHWLVLSPTDRYKGALISQTLQPNCWHSASTLWEASTYRRALTSALTNAQRLNWSQRMRSRLLREAGQLLRFPWSRFLLYSEGVVYRQWYNALSPLWQPFARKSPPKRPNSEVKINSNHTSSEKRSLFMPHSQRRIILRIKIHALHKMAEVGGVQTPTATREFLHCFQNQIASFSRGKGITNSWQDLILPNLCMFTHTSVWRKRYFGPQDFASYRKKYKSAESLNAVFGNDLPKGTLWENMRGSNFLVLCNYSRILQKVTLNLASPQLDPPRAKWIKFALVIYGRGHTRAKEAR